MLLVLSIIFVQSAIALGQNYNIEYDTIRVHNTSGSVMRLPGEVQSQRPVCDNNLYSITVAGTNIIVKSSDKVGGFCVLLVEEGELRDVRSHLFVLQTTDDLNTANIVYDVHTLDLVQQRITDMQNKPKPSAVPQIPQSTTGVGPQPSAPVQQPVAEAPVQSTPSTTAEKSDDPISEIDPEELKDQIEKKIQAFLRCCERLGRKINVTETIEIAMTLFDNDDNVIVESESKKTGIRKQKPIRKYLYGLSLLNYTSISIRSKNIQFVSDIHKNPDGTYSASVIVYQVFEGMRGERTIYKDVTEKKVNVKIVIDEVVKEGQLVRTWDIFLSDIKVLEVQ